MNSIHSLDELGFASMIRDISRGTSESSVVIAEFIAERLASYFLLQPVGAEFMNFLDSMFHCEGFVSGVGYDRVVGEIYSNRDKFSAVQLKDISSWIVDGFDCNLDTDYALVTCDFIARTHSFEGALAIFEKALAKSSAVSSLEGVLLGLDVLRMQSMMTSRPTLEVDKVTSRAIARLNDIGDHG